MTAWEREVKQALERIESPFGITDHELRYFARETRRAARVDGMLDWPTDKLVRQMLKRLSYVGATMPDATDEDRLWADQMTRLLESSYRYRLCRERSK